MHCGLQPLIVCPSGTKLSRHLHCAIPRVFMSQRVLGPHGDGRHGSLLPGEAEIPTKHIYIFYDRKKNCLFDILSSNIKLFNKIVNNSRICSYKKYINNS